MGVMTLDEARELLTSPAWPRVRDHFLAGNAFAVYPAGDLRWLDFLPDQKRQLISRWCDAAAKLPEWKKIVEGHLVRELKRDFPEVYPEILRYEAYFRRCANDEDRLRMVLRMKFPDVLEFIASK